MLFTESAQINEEQRARSLVEGQQIRDQIEERPLAEALASSLYTLSANMLYLKERQDEIAILLRKLANDS